MAIFHTNTGGIIMTDDPEQLFWQQLVDKTKALGRKATHADVAADPEMTLPNNYAHYWGSFKNAAESAWRYVNTAAADGGSVAPQKRRGRPLKYTVDEVRQLVQTYYDTEGSLPKQATSGSDFGLPSWETILNALGPDKTTWLQQMDQMKMNN